MKCPACRNDMDGLGDICAACFLAEISGGENGGVDAGFTVPGVILRGEIARGGVGIVYRGEQVKPDRPVAVKIIQPQWADNATVHHRFRREAQAMAGLEHPAILPVYEVGESCGLSWFTMKLAGGGSLARRVADFRGQWREIASLCATLAEALCFAHQRGVLHRDIKPGNVLFDGDDRPYLGDFGAAKHSRDASLTLPSDVLGTPNYLPPEIAKGGSGAATTSGDIYGLGTVLYELLSGHPPHRAEDLPALLSRIATTAPPSLAGCRPVPPRDLVAICERAMEKEPRHRYATADAMAADLRNFLAGKPTIARPLGRVEAAKRWCHAHPALASLASLVLLLLATVAAVSTVAAWRIRSERENAKMHLRDSLLAQSAGVRLARSPGFRGLALKLADQRVTGEEDGSFRTRRRSEVISALAFPTIEISPMPEPPARGMEFATVSPGGKFIAWRAAPRSPAKRDAFARVRALFNGPPAEGWQITRSADGAMTAQGVETNRLDYLSADGQWMTMQDPGQSWQLWHAGSVVFTSPGTVQDLSADGRLAAWHQPAEQGRKLARVRDNETGKILMSLDYPSVALVMKLSPDQQFCAVAPSFYSGDPRTAYSVRIYRCSDGALVRELASGLGNCVWCMTWSLDGRSLLAAERNGPVYIWEAASGNIRHILRGPGTQVWRAAFSPDGQMLAMLAEDSLFSVFDLASGRPLVQGTAGILKCANFQWQSPVSFGPVSIDGQAKLLRLAPGAFASHQSPDARGGIQGIAASPDGRWIALGDARHAWVWDSHRRKAHPHFANGLWNGFCFSPDGRWLYGAGEAGVKRWSFGEDGVGESHVLSPNGFHNSVAVDRTGEWLAFHRVQDRQTTVLQKPDSMQPGRKFFPQYNAHWLDLSRDGRLLAAASPGGLQIWSVPDGKVLHTDPRLAKCVRFSPDGEWLFIAADRHEIWSAKTWKRECVLGAPEFSSLAAQGAFHPGKPLFAAGCSLGRIGLWSTKDWSLLAMIENPNQLPVERIGFDASGHRLHFGSQAGIFATWDFALLEQELAARGLVW